MPSTLPELPDPRVAEGSARAWAEADPRLAALLSAGNSTPRALLRWGTDLLRSGRAVDAVTALRASAALDPAQSEVWANLGIALDRAGGGEAATGCFERSVALSREQPDTWLLLGMGREKQGDLAGAEEDYRTALALAPTSASAWKCLGTLLDRNRDASGAIAALTEYRKHGPRDGAVAGMLGRLLYEDGLLREAADAYAEAVSQQPDNAHFRRMARQSQFTRQILDEAPVDEALASLRDGSDGPVDDAAIDELLHVTSGLLAGFGHRDAALKVARVRAEMSPGNVSATYLLTSLEGRPATSSPSRSPDAYIVESFDAFAEKFEAQLVGTLGYDVPEKLGALFGRHVLPDRLHEAALDAGCGTGLFGPWLRPLARRLTGVDLSPKMLERARARGIYDALVCAELTQFLESADGAGAFDLVACADVVIYFGELPPLFRALASALRPGGLLGLSFESLRDAESPAASSADWSLGPAGRYAHAPRYVRAVAQPAFDIVEESTTTLRREGRERVMGQLLVLRRRG